MKLLPELVFQFFCRFLCLAVLRFASLLVPGPLRAEWWREWRSELWHVRQACTPLGGVSWSAEREVGAFCLGAFPDALYLRAHAGRLPRATTMGSATQCVGLLAGLIAASFGVAVLLPGVRAELYQTRYRIAPSVMLIQSARSPDDSVATISAEQFRVWKRRRQQLFDGFAFYQVTQESVPNASHSRATLGVAHASSNLFQLLGLPVRYGTVDARATGPGVVLSEALWKRSFGADPHVVGRLVQVGLHRAVVVGIAPAGSWTLPGRVDAWLLEPDATIGSVGDGFVAAHLAPSSQKESFGPRWHMSAPTPDGTADDFLCVSLSERPLGRLDIFLFSVILACLALPATTSLPLGEYRLGSRKLSWSTRLRRWSFLTGKIALLLPIVYFLSLDLAYLRPVVDPNSADYIQLVSSFSICLFGLRWALRDQRQRCPVCLRKLTHPARVGQPSRNFLAWNGTELICVGGHGLLHVPEMPTSWFSTQRWLYLDPSWEILFAETSLASAGYF